MLRKRNRCLGDFAATGEKLMEYGLVELPGAMTVGVGESGASRSAHEPEVIEFAEATLQAAADLARLWAWPSWQKNMATNWSQQEKPLL